MTVKWKCNRRNGSEKEQRKREKAIWTQKGRMSGGGHAIEWSRGESSHISMRKNDRVGGPKGAFS